MEASFGGAKMFCYVLNVNKKGLAAFIFSGFMFTLAAIFIYNAYVERKKCDKQTVMAQELLESGNYNEAIEAYQKAMSMKYGDEELLSVGLAEAYAGIHEYDKALEVLRSLYEDKKTTLVKEKIEDITARKSDYNFNQLISYGDTYFSNKEYNKAIDEYEKAKLIKSREDISYVKIVESYIAMEKYDLAKEEIQEGLALTESEKLKEMLNQVDKHLKELKYEEIINKASEYIYQENYDEALKRLSEAKSLIPEKDTAYKQMAEIYITKKEYDKAKKLLDSYLAKYKSKEAKDILKKVNDLIALKLKKEKMLNELYDALNEVNVEAIIKILKDDFFINNIAKETPVYYSPSGSVNLSMGQCLLITDRYNVYVGGFKDKKKDGVGIRFELIENKNKSGWRYYQGEWNLDMPNGMGKTVEEITISDKRGNKKKLTTKSSGMFIYGTEGEEIKKSYYLDGVEWKREKYTSEEEITKSFEYEYSYQYGHD
jgi:tetratricopeptide (TPR) repeat protein